LLQNAACIVCQLLTVHLAVGDLHNRQGLFREAGILEAGNDILRTVGRGQMRAAFGVITGDGNFVTRQRIHQFFHLLGRFFNIFALRIALNQLGKRLIGLAVGFRVAVGPVL